MPDDGTNVAPSTRDIAHRGEAIYARKYQKAYENAHQGKFVAINVNTEDAFLADTAEDAVRLALDKDPSGLFHLIRVGKPAAFKAGWYMTSANV